MGVEVDTLFDCKMKMCEPREVRTQLKKYKELGLRHVFPLHLFNNGFGGTSYFNQFLVSASATINNNKPILGECAEGYTGVNVKGKNYCSPIGLSEHGKWFLELLMEENMIIDVDHMSRLAFHDALKIAEKKNYPLVSSHSGIRGVFKGSSHGEDKKTDEEIIRIYKLGGMVAPILAARDVGLNTVDGIEHNCSHAATGWANAYAYVRNLLEENGIKAAIGLGSDLNGMINLPGGRFGELGCNGNKDQVANQSEETMIKYPFETLSGEIIEAPYYYLDQSEKNRGERVFDYNFEGLSHVGMMPEFFEDLKMVGMKKDDFNAFMNSAEGFLQMWEKVENSNATLASKQPKSKYTLSEKIEKIGMNEDEIKANQDYDLKCPEEMACSRVSKNKILLKDGENFTKYFLSSGLGQKLSQTVCTEDISMSQGLDGSFCYCRCHRIKDPVVKKPTQSKKPIKKDKMPSGGIIKNTLISRKGIKAETLVSTDTLLGRILMETKAKLAFYTHKDTREFYLDPKLLLSKNIRKLDIGAKFSLDIRTDTPRYSATLVRRNGDKALIEIRDSKKTLDIDLNADLSGPYILFRSGKIYLRKVFGGTTLSMEEK